jgi:kynurenine 3-monooxygenase
MLISKQSILAIDRGGLNKRLLDILEEMPNVKFFFNHKLTGADFRRNKAWFEVREQDSAPSQSRELEVTFDLMIGADGAHSAVRYHMMKYTRMDYEQRYIDTLWCEFQIQPNEHPSKEDPMSKFRISPNHLHIWPGKEFMFIAIPSDVCQGLGCRPPCLTNNLLGWYIYVHPLCPWLHVRAT